jgi:hypothetical protein
MSDGITIRILGDVGPFSRVGKSIGYQVTKGDRSYLIDCGAPLFQELGVHGLKAVDGLIVTHCHDDHKRWFTDLALFHMYAQDVRERICLLTSEDVYDDLMRASGPALDRSLSLDSKRIIDIPHEEYVDYRILGPRARYRIVSRYEGNGKTAVYVADEEGNVVGPDRAKVVVSDKTGRLRMLFKDPDCGEWVEPESYYPFSSTVFYEKDRNVFSDEGGLSIEAVKAPVWHGIPTIGLRITTDAEKVLFSSDTIHNKRLWEQLYTEKRTPSFEITNREFEFASVLFGDINDYIERTWSEERYREAVRAFEDVIVIHDVAMCNSIVHTDYEMLDETVLDRDRTILTHSPDRITSEWVLCDVGKAIRVVRNNFYEVVEDNMYPMNADIYQKDIGKYYVGYRSDNGRYGVYERHGLLMVSADDGKNAEAPLYRVDLYEDLSGKYFPKLEDGDCLYFQREDGKVERVEYSREGSRGRIVEDERDRLRQDQDRKLSGIQTKRS